VGNEGALAGTLPSVGMFVGRSCDGGGPFCVKSAVAFGKGTGAHSEPHGQDEMGGRFLLHYNFLNHVNEVTIQSTRMNTPET
jgi:hypothetical protein